MFVQWEENNIHFPPTPLTINSFISIVLLPHLTYYANLIEFSFFNPVKNNKTLDFIIHNCQHFFLVSPQTNKNKTKIRNKQNYG